MNVQAAFFSRFNSRWHFVGWVMTQQNLSMVKLVQCWVAPHLRLNAAQ
ncbi:hypothetical protein HMPREF0476_0833 [Kingella kingae ATCC 23330]|uniref:Uncharacterized protein n=1 Tax=Kingella kingae ATCC 23330 TaxID=887327 RepID=F5S6K0_KINKI|nr:hypothetical protein HMPREF0476_0833 [Kingella kingae ATCC 23330]